jgi:hypothetical protein
MYAPVDLNGEYSEQKEQIRASWTHCFPVHETSSEDNFFAGITPPHIAEAEVPRRKAALRHRKAVSESGFLQAFFTRHAAACQVLFSDVPNHNLDVTLAA